MKYLHEATFKGRGYFPVDMLRYDSCWPATQEDASHLVIDIRVKDDTVITVRRWSDKRGSAEAWTPKRWESFGWKLVSAINLTKPER